MTPMTEMSSIEVRTVKSLQSGRLKVLRINSDGMYHSPVIAAWNDFSMSAVPVTLPDAPGCNLSLPHLIITP